jgi:membrane-bound lytic murein transglycosylase A
MRALGLLGALAFVLAMPAAARPVLEPVAFAEIEGWDTYDFSPSLAAFRRSCAEIIATGHAFGRAVAYGGERAEWLDACGKAAVTSSARNFFEDEFIAVRVNDPVRPEGLFTGYYEPEAEGSLEPSPDYPVPVYRKPHDLAAFDDAAIAATGLHYGRIADDAPQGYFTRKEIEDGALAGRGLEILWLRDWADAFFIHIQGSGRVRLPDGSRIRLAYAAKSGQPYTGVGRLLVDRGILTEANMSMQAIRAWMKTDPQGARDVMQENASFIFFRRVGVDDARLGPPGAQKVNLTPRISLAVDRSLWMFGTPFWIATDAPHGEEALHAPFAELMIAQDTGTAIKGHVRGDVFWGSGPDAALTAGHMKSPGSMVALLPRALAQRLLAAP